MIICFQKIAYNFDAIIHALLLVNNALVRSWKYNCKTTHDPHYGKLRSFCLVLSLWSNTNMDAYLLTQWSRAAISSPLNKRIQSISQRDRRATWKHSLFTGLSPRVRVHTAQKHPLIEGLTEAFFVLGVRLANEPP